MTDVQALKALRERVSLASGPDREIDGQIALLIGWTLQKMKGDAKPYWRKPGVVEYYRRSDLPAYSSSVDEAILLVEKMMPGHYWRVEKACEYPALVGRQHKFAALVLEWGVSKRAEEGATPALAILAALLSALISQAPPASHGEDKP